MAKADAALSFSREAITTVSAALAVGAHDGVPRAAARVQQNVRRYADIAQSLQHALGNFAVEELGGIKGGASGEL